MFIRQSVLTRYVLAMLGGAMCVFLWNNVLFVTPSFPSNESGRDMGGSAMRLEGSKDTRDNTPVNNSVAIHVHPSSNEHMSGNESLKEAMKNMTLLHVNNSNLQEIIAEVNGLNKKKMFEIDSKNVRNPHNFKYMLNAPTLCTGKDIFMLAYIHTGVGNYKRRMVIRQTWGNPKNYPDVIVRVVFVMGMSLEKPELQQVGIDVTMVLSP